MDPLTLLREYTIRNSLDRIVRVNVEFRFGSDYSFPVTIETAYRSKHVQSTRRYVIETLVHFMNNHNLNHTDYLQHSRSLRIPAVTLPDRKTVTDYLTGKIQSSDLIVPLDFPNIPQIPSLNNVERNLQYYSNDLAIQEDLMSEKSLIGLIRAKEISIKDTEAMLVFKTRDFYSSAMKRDEEKQRM